MLRTEEAKFTVLLWRLIPVLFYVNKSLHPSLSFAAVFACVRRPIVKEMLLIFTRRILAKESNENLQDEHRVWKRINYPVALGCSAWKKRVKCNIKIHRMNRLMVCWFQKKKSPHAHTIPMKNDIRKCHNTATYASMPCMTVATKVCNLQSCVAMEETTKTINSTSIHYFIYGQFTVTPFW